MSETSKLIWGCTPIAETIGSTPRKTYHMLETGRLPAVRVANRWVAREDELLDPASWPGATKVEAK